ncbi:hypothetical protein pdul_cds_363 [Pandoravirus dulcis]|uniref:Uncharacterized protein n=1 Tax=Pandoravirus dulcis TaxID=1349409 RepID=S4VWU6_9VIRU|nr:hypothetical protein pdul_cds_363 [Pandoravirus dulcis]AGO82389.1 hypothetical protein pdul_cds_363 [Pandoravirus dulcis]
MKAPVRQPKKKRENNGQGPQSFFYVGTDAPFWERHVNVLNGAPWAYPEGDPVGIEITPKKKRKKICREEKKNRVATERKKIRKKRQPSSTAAPSPRLGPRALLQIFLDNIF